MNWDNQTEASARPLKGTPAPWVPSPTGVPAIPYQYPSPAVHATTTSTIPPPPPSHLVQTSNTASPVVGPPPVPPLDPVPVRVRRVPTPALHGSAMVTSGAGVTGGSVGLHFRRAPIGVLASGAGAAVMKPQGVRIFVGKIPESIDDKFISILLEQCGTVTDWSRMVDPISNKPKAFGFVTYNNPQGALTAIRLLHDLEVDGGRLLVNADSATQTLLDQYVEKQTQVGAGASVLTQDDDMKRGFIHKLLGERRKKHGGGEEPPRGSSAAGSGAAAGETTTTGGGFPVTAHQSKSPSDPRRSSSPVRGSSQRRSSSPRGEERYLRREPTPEDYRRRRSWEREDPSMYSSRRYSEERGRGYPYYYDERDRGYNQHNQHHPEDEHYYGEQRRRERGRYDVEDEYERRHRRSRRSREYEEDDGGRRSGGGGSSRRDAKRAKVVEERDLEKEEAERRAKEEEVSKVIMAFAPKKKTGVGKMKAEEEDVEEELPVRPEAKEEEQDVLDREVNWRVVTSELFMESVVRPYLKKATVECFGEEDAEFVEFVGGWMLARTSPRAIVGELEGILEADAETFVRKLWTHVFSKQ